VAFQPVNKALEVGKMEKPEGFPESDLNTGFSIAAFSFLLALDFAVFFGGLYYQIIIDR
jgi:hypothetical protein